MCSISWWIPSKCNQHESLAKFYINWFKYLSIKQELQTDMKKENINFPIFPILRKRHVKSFWKQLFFYWEKSYVTETLNPLLQQQWGKWGWELSAGTGEPVYHCRTGEALVLTLLHSSEWWCLSEQSPVQRTNSFFSKD